MGKFYAGVRDELILYTRQLAWLHSSPETPGKKQSQPSRIEGYPDKPPLPPLHTAEYMIKHLWDVGPASSLGMGLVPLSFQELSAWQKTCGHNLQPREMQTLRDMSVAYVSELHQATDVNCPAPWSNVDTVDHAAVADKLRAVFASYSQ